MPEERGGLEMLRVTIAPRELEFLRESSRAARPREACGLLLGTVSGGEARITHVVDTRNTSEAVDRFAIDVRDQLAAERLAQSSQCIVFGTWHSHAQSDAHPSPSDIAGCDAYPLALIVGCAGANTTERAFDTRGRPWRSVELQVAPLPAAENTPRDALATYAASASNRAPIFSSARLSSAPPRATASLGIP